jgi:hypothetical protein
MATRVQTHVLEKVVGTLMVLFGIAAVFIFFSAMKEGTAATADVAIIQILLIIVLAILAQTVILIRLYELNLK